MRVIPFKLMPPGAAAFTVYPLGTLVHPDYVQPLLIKHEAVHFAQQRRWCLYGLGVGLLLWFVLYLFVLPVGWNPFRERWEREAIKAANGLDDEYIDRILSKKPYYLWSLR